MDPKTRIRRYFAAVPGVTGGDVDALLAVGASRRLEAGEAHCALGERQHRLGFLHRGLLRYHVTTKDGEDVTKDFGLANEFTVSFGSAVRGEPAAVAVSALETCELTVWRFAEVERLFAGNLAWERWRRLVAEALYVRKERRELSFLLKSAEERYAEARALFGPALARIPQYHLASYLGIAPESLSRLKHGRRKRSR